MAYQPDAALLWRVAERGLVAAQESEDPHAIGVAAWLAAQAHRDAGPAHFDAADAVNQEALAYLEPPDGWMAHVVRWVLHQAEFLLV